MQAKSENEILTEQMLDELREEYATTDMEFEDLERRTYNILSRLSFSQTSGWPRQSNA